MNIRFRALTRKLNIRPQSLINDAKGYMQDFGDKLVEEVKKYPPIPSESTYMRTYTLHDAWYSKVKQTQSQLTLHIGVDPDFMVSHNKRNYAPYVQGALQTPYHAAHGWINIFDYLSQEKVRSDFRRGLMSIEKMHARGF